MTTYIGTKLIHAQPMTRGEYNTYRGWTAPEGEDQSADGYLVEYLDGGLANDARHKGYISWSPADVFDRAYRPTQAMTFGQALEALKAGQKVARAGWNGKGMFIYHVPAAAYPASRNGAGTMLGYFDDDMVPYRDYIAMKTAQGDVVPWVCSQSDALEEDWEIVQ